MGGGVEEAEGERHRKKDGEKITDWRRERKNGDR